MTNVVCSIIIFHLPIVYSNHFYGGTITWKPMNNTNFSSTVPIMFSQSYQWRQPQTHRDDTCLKNQTRKIPMNGDKLQCVSNSSCSTYTALSVNGYCTDYSTLIDTSSSQISAVETIDMDSTFCIAYRGSTWPGIITNSCGFSCYVDSARWSLGCCLNLTTREDGFTNSAPVGTVISRMIFT